jgi:hypothetical protein
MFNSDTVKRVAWTAAQAFVAAFLVLAPGIFTAPNLDDAKAAAIAAVVAGLAAAVSALKNVIFATDSSLR